MTPKLPPLSAEAFVAPMVEFNKLALAYTEKLVELNLAAARKQADVALASWRDALAVKDPEGIKAYLEHQGEVARELVKDYVAEAKMLSELNQETAADMRKLVETNVAKATQRNG